MKQKQITRIGIAVSAIVIALALWWAFNGAGWTHAATPTGAPYEHYVTQMLAGERALYPYLYALDVGYVQATYSGNAWWLDPLLNRINQRFTYLPKITQDELTKYAIVRAQVIAIQAKSDCEQGLIRDAAPRFPIASEFARCDYPHNQAWWVTQYPFNVQATVDDVDAGQVFMRNGNRKLEFGGLW